MRKVTELTVQTAALGSELQAAHSLLEEMRGENNLPDKIATPRFRASKHLSCHGWFDMLVVLYSNMPDLASWLADPAPGAR